MKAIAAFGTEHIPPIVARPIADAVFANARMGSRQEGAETETGARLD